MARGNTVEFTDKFIKSLKPPATGRAQYWDRSVTGLSLRVTHAGRKSWSYSYRFNGKNQRLTIGPYPLVTLKQAREKARQAWNAVWEGGNPAAEKRVFAPDNTFQAVSAEFIERYCKQHNRTWQETERKFKRYLLPKFGSRLVADISRGEIIEFLDTMVKRGGANGKGAPVQANRVLAALKKFFNWCKERGLVEASPVEGLSAPGKEAKRERVLSDGEIRAVWARCDEIGYPFGPMVQLLLVTAQRREEVAAMRWEDIGRDEHGNLVWTIPAEATKSGRSHQVPFADLAADILKQLPQQGRYVFTSGRVGDKPVSGFGNAKRAIDRDLDIGDWRFHDLRRTAATQMGEKKVATSTISRVLNHAEGGVTVLYARHSYLPEKREALNIWARRLEVMLGRDKGKVVPLRG